MANAVTDKRRANEQSFFMRRKENGKFKRRLRLLINHPQQFVDHEPLTQGNTFKEVAED